MIQTVLFAIPKEQINVQFVKKDISMIFTENVNMNVLLVHIVLWEPNVFLAQIIAQNVLMQQLVWNVIPDSSLTKIRNVLITVPLEQSKLKENVFLVKILTARNVNQLM
jgi:hypothetical protein